MDGKCIFKEARKSFFHTLNSPFSFWTKSVKNISAENTRRLQCMFSSYLQPKNISIEQKSNSSRTTSAISQRAYILAGSNSHAQRQCAAETVSSLVDANSPKSLRLNDFLPFLANYVISNANFKKSHIVEKLCERIWERPNGQVFHSL